MQKSAKNARKQSKKCVDNPIIDAFIKTQVFALIIGSVSFLGSSVLALIFDTPEKYDLYISIAAFSLSTLLIGFFAGMKMRSNGILVGPIFSFPFITLITLCSISLNSFSMDLNCLFGVIAMIICACLGGVFAVNKRLR